jgi:hypothetical protein
VKVLVDSLHDLVELGSRQRIAGNANRVSEDLSGDSWRILFGDVGPQCVKAQR